jgi:hypothetical protein
MQRRTLLLLFLWLVSSSFAKYVPSSLESPFLTSDPASSTARFGQDQAVSSDGKTLVIVAGGYFAPASPPLSAGVRGMVYVYTRPGVENKSPWTLAHRLVPIDTDSPNQNLVLASSGATAVAVSKDGKVIVVGAIGAQVNMSNAIRGYGAAYTWVLNENNVYVPVKRVIHPSCLRKGINVLAVNPTFGRSVSISDDGNILAVSSYLSTNIFTIFRKTTNPTNPISAGSIYWEFLSNETVIAEGYPADAKTLIRTRMAMSGDGTRVFISHYIGEVNGKVDAYRINSKGTPPTYISTLRPIGNSSNIAACNFGLAISSTYDGNRVIVSAPFYNGIYQLSGATFIFDYDITSSVYKYKAILGNTPETVRPNADCGWPIKINQCGTRIALACTSAPISPGSRITTGGAAVYEEVTTAGYTCENRNPNPAFNETFWITANDLPLGVAYFPTSIGCLTQDCRQLSLGIDAWRNDFAEQGAAYFWSPDADKPASLPPNLPPGKRDEALVYGTPILIEKTQVLPPADASFGADEAGYDVSVSDDGSIVCVVENGRVPSGAITVYSNRVFLTRLTLPDTFANQPLAAGMYVSGNGQAIVAISNPISNALENVVYTWTKSGTSFVLDATTLAVKTPTGAQAALFFNALAISRDAHTLVATWTYTTVTGEYTAYVSVFTRTMNTNKWSDELVLSLKASDTSYTFRNWLGQGGVAISADALLIAAATDGGGRPGLSPGDAGYVATFKRKSLNDPFIFEAVMTSAVRSDSAYLFWPLAVSGDGNTIAGYLNDNTHPGRVIVWVRDSNNKWPSTPSKVLNLTDISQETEDDSFGSALSLSDDGTRLLVGSYLASIYGTLSGIVVFYSRSAGPLSGSNWTTDFMLYPSGGADGTSFGSGVALTGNGLHAFIGAPGGGEKGEGVVYVWDPPSPPSNSQVPIVAIAVSATVVAIVLGSAILICILSCGRKVQVDRQRRQQLKKTLGSAAPEHLSIRNVGTFHEVDEY